MAKYIITNINKDVVGLAESEAHKTVWDNISDDYNFISVSDDNFTKLKTFYHEVSNIDSSNNVTYRDLISGAQDAIAYTQDQFTFEVNNLKSRIQEFIDNHSDSDLKTSATNFKTYLDSFDLTSITYPKDSTLFQHWEDNSVTYLNPLQIP